MSTDALPPPDPNSLPDDLALLKQLVFTDLVHDADVWVPQTGRGLCFAKNRSRSAVDVFGDIGFRPARSVRNPRPD